ncbi:MAG: hypothetical protein L6R41_002079 [Letrouitia leprolyta]|nr:MAG: hypothetical protein L6R41_002079 [Letrouitia leprolyta]
MIIDHGQGRGGESVWSVLLTGLKNNVGSVQDSSSEPDPSTTPNPPPKVSSPTTPTSTTSIAPVSPAKSKPSSPAAAVVEPDSTKNKPPSTITRASTIVVTAPGQTQAVPVVVETHKASKGPNTTGIAVGVVVGVIAICAIAGGLFFFLRNRKRRAMAETFQSNSANPFETESKPPPSSCSMSDSRLEPSVMMQRRQSDGSIADNQDYSRRILKRVPMSLRSSVANGGVDKTASSSPSDGGQEKQKKLLATDAGHFSMIKYSSPLLPRPGLQALIGLTKALLNRALHLADLITELNGTPAWVTSVLRSTTPPFLP